MDTPRTASDAETHQPKKEKKPAYSGPQFRPGEYFTDRQLQKRWQCSPMRLWRLRKNGKLPKPIKICGAGVNLTPASVVFAVEGGAVDVEPRAA